MFHTVYGGSNLWVSQKDDWVAQLNISVSSHLAALKLLVFFVIFCFQMFALIYAYSPTHTLLLSCLLLWMLAAHALSFNYNML